MARKKKLYSVLLRDEYNLKNTQRTLVWAPNARAVRKEVKDNFASWSVRDVRLIESAKHSVPRRNPAKLERCVADVKRKGGAANPWAVCTAMLQRTGELPRKRRNPTSDEWIAWGEEMYGRKETPPHRFPSGAAAKAYARKQAQKPGWQGIVARKNHYSITVRTKENGQFKETIQYYEMRTPKL